MDDNTQANHRQAKKLRRGTIMLWYWVDQYIELHHGISAKAVKMVTAAERHLFDQYPESPRLPMSLIMEGMAQIAGELVSDAIGHQKMVIMAKIVKAEFYFDAIPGDCLEYSATILQCDAAGSRVKVTSTVKGYASQSESTVFDAEKTTADRRQAEVEIVFAHLTHQAAEQVDSSGQPRMVRFGPEVLQEWMERAGASQVRSVDTELPPISVHWV